MPNLSIKDVPEALAEALRQRAARNHRSLQGELMSIIESASAESAYTPQHLSEQRPQGGPRIVGYDQRGFPIVRQGWKTVQQIAAELQTKFPEPISDQLSSVEITRQARDSR